MTAWKYVKAILRISFSFGYSFLGDRFQTLTWHDNFLTKIDTIWNMWLQKTFLWKTWTLYGCGPKVRPSAPVERIIANCYQHCHRTIKTRGVAWHLDHLEHFYHIGKEEKSLSPEFLSQVVLSSRWSLYLASTSPMHLVLNFLLNIHVALQDLQGIKDNWLSLRNIKWLSLFPLYLRRPLPNVSSLSLLMYSPSFAKNQWWSVFPISESFSLLS